MPTKTKRKKLTENRPKYDREYYARNRERILEQHRQNYRRKKGFEKMEENLG